MANKLNLDKIIPLFKTNQDFSREAEKYGYSLEVQERTILLKKQNK